MDNYCTTCGRCQNCGARQGASPTMFFPTTNNAAAAPMPTVINTPISVGGAPAMGLCEHFKVVQ